MKTEDIKELNSDRAKLRSRVNELEGIMTKWAHLLKLAGIDYPAGPERAQDRLLQLIEQTREAPRHLALLRAYEAQMRYRVEVCDRDNYDSPGAVVVDYSPPEPTTVCGCGSLEEAAMVAASLNATQRKTT